MGSRKMVVVLAAVMGLGVGVAAWGEPAVQGAAGHGAAGHDAAVEKTDLKAIWADLVEGNKRFVADKEKDRELIHTREELSKGQRPKVMVLACADSRVSPELVFDKTLGELFVCRVAGNVADPAVVGSMEYAVEHLGARVLVVLGHDSCGAVAAAASGEEMPTAGLKDIVSRIQPALATVEKVEDKGELSKRQVRANVVRAAEQVEALSPMLKKEIEEGKVLLVRAVYHLKSGEVEKVE